MRENRQSSVEQSACVLIFWSIDFTAGRQGRAATLDRNNKTHRVECIESTLAFYNANVHNLVQCRPGLVTGQPTGRSGRVESVIKVLTQASPATVNLASHRPYNVRNLVSRYLYNSAEKQIVTKRRSHAARNKCILDNIFWFIDLDFGQKFNVIIPEPLSRILKDYVV